MLTLASTFTDCVSNSAFASLDCVSVGITSSAAGLKICAVMSGIKKYKSILKKKKKKHDIIVLSRKYKLNTIENLISKALIYSFIIHDEFVPVNNVWRGYNVMEEEIKKSWNFCGTHYINMVDISRKVYEISGIEPIADNEGILWLNKKTHTKEGLDYKNFREITIQYYSDYGKCSYKLVHEPKKRCNIIFIDEKLGIKGITDCKTIH